ncbi:MAG: hypothetical protein CMG61_06015, partial [Candidatus Marinimicrobia bacterium]|nr:hypothetical protein [Candidatus Neomarinimicrobiota bacterium]
MFNNSFKMLSKTLISFLFLGSFLLAEPTDGCELSSNQLYLTTSGEVLYNTDSEIGGFQFTVDGTTASAGSGGDAAAAGFTVSTGGSTVLGFSFTGGTVPVGCGTLTSLTLDGDATGLSGIVVSDPVGQSIPFDYFTIVSGCTDETACNYDSTATEDDGSCTFAEENFDCDGNYTGPTANVQIIHNSASPTVDVYVDGGLAISGFEYRTATGLLELPTSFTV